MIGLISVGLNALYGTFALTLQESHWYLSDNESLALATQAHQALETLPGEIYEQLTKHIEKFIPWVGLAITASAITAPRIKQSAANRAARKASPGAGGRTEPSGSEWETPSASTDGARVNSYRVQ